MDKKKVLIVDDSADTRLIFSARLKAQQAVSMALKERPDAILLDLGLPGGNGLIVLQRLKANTVLSAIPVIIVTAEAPQMASRAEQSRPFKAGVRSNIHSTCKCAHFKLSQWRGSPQNRVLNLC